MRLAVIVLLWSGVAAGYEERVHRLLEEQALAADLLDAPVSPEMTPIRALVWRAGSVHPDPDVRRRFLARWPTEWDEWAFKEFLGLTPEAKVVGIDVMPPLPAAPRVRDVIVPASSQPDDDRRNQERFAHDEARRVRLDPWGRPLPADPAQLDMGPLRGLASQGYAHYGLPRGPFSDDTDVLKNEPWRWAYPPTARAFAPAFAQLFTDLALVAARSGAGERDALGWLFLGHAHHYLGDVCNQIHTLQAIYPFFFDAKIESYKEELLSLGGLLRDRRGFISIGIDIIGNHHLLAEDLWAKRVLAGAVGAALAAVRRGDPALEGALAGIDGPGFAAAMTQVVIEASPREGAAVYEAIRELAVRRLSRAGEHFDDTMDPDAFIRRDAEPRVLARFYELEAAGFARAGTALRRHVELYRAALGAEGAADRLVATQLRGLEEREARLAAWQPRPPEALQVNWLVPGGLAAFLALLAVLVWWIRRAVARRRAARRAPPAA